MNYFIDWTIFITQRLPYVLRKPLQIAWIKALIAPLIIIYNAFTSAVVEFRIRAKITPQVRILRGALNSYFDATERRITIEDGTGEANLFIFNVSENKPVYLPKFITGANSVYFIVKIPSVLAAREGEIFAFLKTYKLVGTRFKIVII
jgi:hypothetical protein